MSCTLHSQAEPSAADQPNDGWRCWQRERACHFLSKSISLFFLPRTPSSPICFRANRFRHFISVLKENILRFRSIVSFRVVLFEFVWSVRKSQNMTWIPLFFFTPRLVQYCICIPRRSICFQTKKSVQFKSCFVSCVEIVNICSKGVEHVGDAILDIPKTSWSAISSRWQAKVSVRVVEFGHVQGLFVVSICFSVFESSRKLPKKCSWSRF